MNDRHHTRSWYEGEPRSVLYVFVWTIQSIVHLQQLVSSVRPFSPRSTTTTLPG